MDFIRYLNDALEILLVILLQVDALQLFVVLAMHRNSYPFLI